MIDAYDFGLCVCEVEMCWCSELVDVTPEIKQKILNNEDYILSCPLCAKGLHVMDPVFAMCQTCQGIRREGGFGPPHNASPRCESGGHNHCSCDTCF